MYGLGRCKYCIVCFIDDNAKKKEIIWNMILYKEYYNDVNQICIIQYCYLTINTRTIRSIRSKYKLYLFNANWSYSYDLKIDFTTYQRMRVNSLSWDGTHPKCYKVSYIKHACYFSFQKDIKRGDKSPMILYTRHNESRRNMTPSNMEVN